MTRGRGNRFSEFTLEYCCLSHELLLYGVRTLTGLDRLHDSISWRLVDRSVVSATVIFKFHSVYIYSCSGVIALLKYPVMINK